MWRELQDNAWQAIWQHHVDNPDSTLDGIQDLLERQDSRWKERSTELLLAVTLLEDRAKQELLAAAERISHCVDADCEVPDELLQDVSRLVSLRPKLRQFTNRYPTMIPDNYPRNIPM